jgi:dTDP-4-dehydrorhamnose reductase
MKILLTGGAGILGGHLIETAPEHIAITATFHRNVPKSRGCSLVPLDIADAAAVVSLCRETRPDVVIHTAGAANVDFCQNNPEQGYSGNVTGTKNIIEACKASGSRLIHISSNAVYGGDFPPYGEDSPTEPVNVYGKLKQESDQLIRGSGLSWTIIRPILMYGWSRPWSRKDFVVWIIESLKAQKQISLVTDIFENPLSAEVCARAIWKCAEKNITGEFNLAGRDSLNRYQLGQEAAGIFGYDAGLIQPVKNDSFKNIAPRPANTSFDTSKMVKTLGLIPQPLSEGLQRMKETLPPDIDRLERGRLLK